MPCDSPAPKKTSLRSSERLSRTDNTLESNASLARAPFSRSRLPCETPDPPARSLMNLLARFVFVFLAALPATFGQAPAAPALVSPEVHPDRRVTFRLAASKATEVTFKGDWHNDPLKLTKADDGVWSLTIDPLPPSTYIYAFTVDGVAMADPVNPRMKLRARTSASLVEIPSGGTSLQEARDVPHGAVAMHWHKATAIGDETRSFWVYTPPGYEQNATRRYPVLYLLHGNNDRPAGWTDVGNIHFLADNLIAAGRMAPMLIVMPYGHALPFGQRGQAPRTNTTVFADYLLKDVIPFTNEKYRVAAGREHHAIAGFSMGGEQSLHVFFKNLDRFSAIGAFSSAAFRALTTDHGALLEDPDGTNAKIAVFFVTCGRQDSAFPNSQQLVDTLTAKKIRHVWRATDGRHNHAFVRDRMEEFLPLLFRAAK